MHAVRNIIDTWVENGFNEPPPGTEHLFWDTDNGWQPTSEAIRIYKENPEHECDIQVSGHTLATCDGYDCTLVRLPSGQWVESLYDGTWCEYDDGWVVCWQNDNDAVAHLFKVS